jgi:hypothetical protein
LSGFGPVSCMDGVLHWVDGVYYVGTIPLGWGTALFHLAYRLQKVYLGLAQKVDGRNLFVFSPELFIVYALQQDSRKNTLHLCSGRATTLDNRTLALERLRLSDPSSSRQQ